MTKPRGRTCHWTQDADGLWHTQCGTPDVYFYRVPGEDGPPYCCYCGAPLVAVTYTQEREDDDTLQL